MTKISVLRARRIAVGLLFLWLLLPAACGPKSKDSGTETSALRVGLLNGPSAISMVGLMDQGFPHGTFDFQIHNEPDQIRAMMYREELDLAFLPITMGALTYNRGFKYQLLGVSGWGALYLIGRDKSVRTIHDLKGKTVHMMGRGMTPDLLFRFLLERAGLQPGVDVNLNYSFPSHVELANVVRAERAELGVLSEPMASMVLDQNPNLVQALDLQAAWDSLHHHQVSLPQTAVMIRDDFAAQNPELVTHLEEAMRTSIEWVKDHPSEAGQLVARFGILPDARVAAASIPRCNFGFQTASEVKPALQNFYSLMAELNPDSIGGSLPDDEFYYKR